MKKLVVLLLCLFVIGAVSTFAGGQGETGKSKSVRVGVSLLTRQHVFYNSIEKALTAEAQSLGYEVIVKDANRDSNLQASQVQDFITQGVDAIILSPTSSAGIAPAVHLAKTHNIPVFTMDIAAESNEVVSHVGTDNYAGGKLAGRYMADKILQGKGEVAVVTYSEVESCVNREKGFKEVIDTYPGIKLVDVENCSGSGDKAASLTQDMLVKFPNLNAIFGVGDPFSLGAYASVKAANRQVKVLGFDGNPEGIAEIQKGGLYVADIAQNPEAIGKTVVDLVRDYLDGKEVPKTVLIPPKVIDQSNL